MPATHQRSVPAWRSSVSILLILHLFCLGVALTSNFGGQSSPVARSLRKIPLVVPYLQVLGMDLSYEFSLASGSPQDAPHRLELNRFSSPDNVLAELPDSTMGGPRERRYRQLAAYAADLDEVFAENADLGTQLPLAIAEGWSAKLKLPEDNYVLRCRRQLPARLQSKQVPKPPSDEDAEAEAFELQLIWSPGENRYQAARRQPMNLTSQARPRTMAKETADAPQDNSDAGP